MKAKLYCQTFSSLLLNPDKTVQMRGITAIVNKLMREAFNDIKAQTDLEKVPFPTAFVSAIDDKNRKWNKIRGIMIDTYKLDPDILRDDAFKESVQAYTKDMYAMASMIEATKELGVKAGSKDDFPYKAKPDTIPTPLQKPQ